jgi:lipopolysaccharide biosynthesis protein
MEVLKFIFSKDSLIVTYPPPEAIASAVPNWHILSSPRIEPNIAQKIDIIAPIDPPRLGIICHAYNVSKELLGQLDHIIKNYRPSSIVLTTDTDSKKNRLEGYLASLPMAPVFCDVLVVPNHGRDVLPFWIGLKAIAAHADVFLKIHWKQSPHLDQHFPQFDGQPACNAWNTDLFTTLLPDSLQELRDILILFKQANLSCIFPRPWQPLWHLHWHSHPNMLHAATLLEELNCPKTAMLIPLIFPAGNMFYGSVPFFEKFLDFFLAKDDYPGEPLPADGTVLHAIERIYTLISASNGFNIASLFPPSTENSGQDIGHHVLSKRRIVLFPVADLLQSCNSASENLNTANALPLLYQSLMVTSSQKLIQSNQTLRSRLKWFQVKSYPSRIKAWLLKKIESSI